MFTFTENYEFDWPVTVKYPGAEAEQEASFTARFLLVPEDEMFSKSEHEGDPESWIKDAREKFAVRLVGWSGIALEGGGELAFSPEARDRLLMQRPIRIAVMQAYSDAVIYGGQAEKN